MGGALNDTPPDHSFEEWLERTAENKELSVEQLRQQLMSSYWILDEVARHLDAGAFQAESPVREQAGENEFPPSELEGLIALVDSLKAFDSESAPNADDPDKVDLELYRFVAGLDGQLSDVSDRLEDVDQRVDTRYAELDDRLEAAAEAAVRPVYLEVVGSALRRQLSTLAEDVDTVETTIDEEVDRIDSVLAEHADGFDQLGRHVSQQADRLDALDMAIEDRDDELEALSGQLSALGSRVAQLEESLQAQHDAVSELRTSVEDHDSDLDAAHQVFRHVIDEVNRLDGRTDDIVAAVGNLDPVVAAHYDRERLADIRKEAARLDIWRATCESCDRTVNIDRLDRPACPHCQEPIGELVRRRGWLRTKSILVSADEPTKPEAPMAWDEGLWPADDENMTADAGFVWGGE